MTAVDTRDFRLTKQVRPRRYEISLDLDLTEWTSAGRERIELEIDAPTSEVILHSDELTITSAGIDSKLQMTSVSYQDESETATLTFNGEILVGHHILEIGWDGPIREALRGLYRSTHGGVRYAATQFEATDARRAFP